MVEVPRIKVCGLTRQEDVRAAVSAGADALGFVRYTPSARDVDPDDVRRLLAGVPPGVATVAVLVDTTPEEARAHLAATGLGWIQLCGDERAQDWAGFEAPLLRRLGVEPGAERELERWRDVAAGFVLDHPSGPGGTGRTVDQGLAARLAALAPCLLAGGLTAGNVAERIRAVRPHGVDASSGLEEAPGVKDAARVADYVEGARSALGRSER